MPDQNWVLIAQQQIPYSNPTSAVQFQNLNSSTATSEAGVTVTLNASNAPVYRMFAKYTIHTSSAISNTQGYSYIYSTSQHDHAQEWNGENQNTYLYSNNQTTGASNASYYTTGTYWGYGAQSNQYSMYGWGAQITDDAGVVVEPYDRRRQGQNVGCWEFYSTEQMYPVHSHWTMICTEGIQDGSNQTSSQKWGGYELGSGGSNQSYSTNEFYWQCSYNVSGTFLFYRSCNGNYQKNE